VERRRESVDLVLGVLGFFIGLLLISTVAAEVRGDDSLARALTLAILVVLFYVLLRIRHALVLQQAAVRDQMSGRDQSRG
jgi:hypothetical protein